jgi:hypothetical protein
VKADWEADLESAKMEFAKHDWVARLNRSREEQQNTVEHASELSLAQKAAAHREIDQAYVRILKQEGLEQFIDASRLYAGAEVLELEADADVDLEAERGSS